MCDYVGFFCLKAQFIFLGIAFGSHRKRVQQFWAHSFQESRDIFEVYQEGGGSDFKRLEQWHNKDTLSERSCERILLS